MSTADCFFARVVPYRFRWLHHLYASLGAYFWLPCPLCGREFGGHEWLTGPFSSVPDGEPGRRSGICPPCTKTRELDAANA